MIFRNTFKLLFTNFSLTYKVLIYKLIILLLSIGVAGTIAVPVISHLSQVNYFSFLVENILSLFQTINLGNVFITLKDILGKNETTKDLKIIMQLNNDYDFVMSFEI